MHLIRYFRSAAKKSHLNCPLIKSVFYQTQNCAWRCGWFLHYAIWLFCLLKGIEQKSRIFRRQKKRDFWWLMWLVIKWYCLLMGWTGDHTEGWFVEQIYLQSQLKDSSGCQDYCKVVMFITHNNDILLQMRTKQHYNNNMQYFQNFFLTSLFEFCRFGQSKPTSKNPLTECLKELGWGAES